MTNLSTQLATGEKSTTYAGMGSNEGFAIAARSQLANISAFTDTISNVSTPIIGGQHRAAGVVEHRQPGAERRGRNTADARQHRTNHRPGECIGRTVLDGRHSQHPGRRPLHVFRHRDQYAGDGAGRRDAQRHRDPGRIEDGDRRTRAGRRHHRHRPSHDHATDPDAARDHDLDGKRSPKMPPVRRSA